MEGPGGELGAAVERIMAKIRVHLKDDPDSPGFHYNRTYEAVTFELQRFQVFVTARNAELRDPR